MEKWRCEAIRNCQKEIKYYEENIKFYLDLLNIYGNINNYKDSLELNQKLYEITLNQIKYLRKSDEEIFIEIIIDKIKNIFKTKKS